MKARHLRLSLTALGFLLFLPSCAIQLSDCSGPIVGTQTLFSIRKDQFLEGPRGFLVLPNPIDSQKLQLFDFNASTFRNAQEGVGLPRLLQNTNQLESSLVKVSADGSGNNILSPQSLSEASSDVNSPLYGQVMAYHAITSIQDYVQSLGFQIDRSKKIHVKVDANPRASAPNAFYTHQKHSSEPHTIELVGRARYPFWADRDAFWHEFGHFFNESLTLSQGVDDAGDSGSTYTEGAALHECLADYLAETASDRGYTGRWLAKNFENEIPLGFPLRSALPLNDDKNDFRNVSRFISSEGVPDTYAVAEWCSRVLWDIRSQFVKEDKQTGSFYSDRVVFSAFSMLGENASLSEFRSALLEADQDLHCGLHQASIGKAFSSKGFREDNKKATQPLQLADIQLNQFETSQFRVSFSITNPNRGLARNVRVELISDHSSFVPLTYFQGYGDLEAGQRAQNIPGVTFHSSSSLKARLYLKVFYENGPETYYPLDLN